MDKFNFDNKLNSLEHNYFTFKKLLWISMLGNLLLLIILTTTINKEKIILVPQVAPEYKLWVTQSQVSNEYLSTLSRNIVDLMLSITPFNVEAQHQELLKLIASKYQADLKIKLSNISNNSFLVFNSKKSIIPKFEIFCILVIEYAKVLG